MTLGTGIFASTVLVLFVLALHQVTVRKRWRTVMKVVAIGVLVIALGGIGLWGWWKYNDRPRSVDTLNGVRLGMTPVEVKLAKGAPTESANDVDAAGKQDSMVWTFKEAYSPLLFVLFRGETEEQSRVSIVCEDEGYSKVFGIGNYTAEADVLAKLGAPTATSIDEDGLSKMISYKPYKVAFRIAKGSVNQLCVSDSGKVEYKTEYNSKEKQR